MTDPAPFEARLLRVMTYIYNNLDGDLSLDAVADVAAMSPHHWHRVFRELTGETLADTVRTLRMLKAANALLSEDATLAEVGERFGYPNLASFSRAFSALHGQPPGAFRGQGLERAEAAREATAGEAAYPVVIQDLPAARAAGILHTGALDGVGLAFQQLGGVLAARQLFGAAQSMIAVYHDAPGSRPEAEMRTQAAVLIGPGFPEGIEGLAYFDLPGGRHAVLQHQGPYATLGSAYAWLYGRWLPGSGEEPRDAPPVELYVSDPRTTPPEALRTDIRLPLA